MVTLLVLAIGAATAIAASPGARPAAAAAGAPGTPAPAGETAAAPEPAAYQAAEEAWRREREARLRAPDGWLALVGLHWLHDGPNRFGSARDDDVRLPAATPAHAGTLVVDGKRVLAAIAPGVTARLNGKPWTAAAREPSLLRTDVAEGGPDVLALGEVTLQVIERGGRIGARVKDPASAARREFAGLAWYPIALAFRAVARLERHPLREITVPDFTGGKQRLRSPGTLAFTLQGKAVRLEPVRDGPDDADLLVVFRDATSAAGATYGGGRFVRARRLPDGQYLIDFNRAYSPPCAFTPYATCPLPPPQNRLRLEIAAGEKTPPGHVR